MRLRLALALALAFVLIGSFSTAGSARPAEPGEHKARQERLRHEHLDRFVPAVARNVVPNRYFVVMKAPSVASQAKGGSMSDADQRSATGGP